MPHTTRIKLANLREVILAEEGVINPEDVRQVTVENAVVDTGATRLSLPKRSLRKKLGLTLVGSRKARTTNGTVDRIIYSAVQFTVLEQQGAILVTALPGHLSVLVGHMVLEKFDLCLDIRKGLIYNPDYGDEWIEDRL